MAGNSSSYSDIFASLVSSPLVPDALAAAAAAAAEACVGLKLPNLPTANIPRVFSLPRVPGLLLLLGGGGGGGGFSLLSVGHNQCVDQVPVLT